MGDGHFIDTFVAAGTAPERPRRLDSGRRQPLRRVILDEFVLRYSGADGSFIDAFVRRQRPEHADGSGLRP